MKLVLDEFYDLELTNYLMTQEGINDVEVINKDFISKINIDFDKTTSPIIIFKFIELFQNNEYSTLLAFDKDINLKTKKIKYILDDICCDYCFKGLIKDLFLNEKIKSVNSDFDFYKSTFDVELVIELYEDYSEEDLKKYIESKK